MRPDIHAKVRLRPSMVEPLGQFVYFDLPPYGTGKICTRFLYVHLHWWGREKEAWLEFTNRSPQISSLNYWFFLAQSDKGNVLITGDRVIDTDFYLCLDTERLMAKLGHIWWFRFHLDRHETPCPAQTAMLN